MRINVYIEGRRTSIGVDDDMFALFRLATGGQHETALSEIYDFVESSQFPVSRPGACVNAWMAKVVSARMLDLGVLGSAPGRAVSARHGEARA